jgi:NitT/TauT family transport system substrate-binding protein
VLEFQSGQIAGGWEPEPYATEMVLDGGTRLVNEASLWPGGKFVTTNLVVTQSFLKAHPSTVNGLLKGQIEANSYINANPSAAASAANAELTKLLGKGLKPNLLTESLKYITFTDNPIASSLMTDAQHAVDVGLLTPVKNLSGIYDLGPLNALLKADGQPQVSP